MSSARSTSTKKKKARGQIWFVGAGPGDPELLTLRSAAALADADTVVVDADLPAGPLLSRCRDDVEVHEVDGSDHATSGKLVVREAKAGHQVVRLVGGDPVLFGPFADEAAACAKAGLAYEVLPGVSAGIGVPA